MDGYYSRAISALSLFLLVLSSAFLSINLVVAEEVTFDFHKHKLEYWGDSLIKYHQSMEMVQDDLKLIISPKTQHKDGHLFHSGHSDPDFVYIHQTTEGIGVKYKSKSLFGAPIVDEGGIDSYAGYIDRLDFSFIHANSGKGKTVRIKSITFKLFEPLFGIDSAVLNLDSPKRSVIVDDDHIGSELEFVPFAPWKGDIHRTTSWNFDTSELTKSLQLKPGDHSTFKIFSMTVEVINSKPEFLSEPPLSAKEGDVYRYDVESTDEEGSEITYSIPTGPNGMSIDSLGNLLWTPDYTQAGKHNVEVVAVDTDGASSSQQFTINVSNTNRAPVVVNLAINGKEDFSSSVLLKASDADSDPLTYSIITQPSYGTLTGKESAYVYEPAPDFNGTDAFEYSVSDGSLSSTAKVDIVIAAINDAPVITSQAPVDALEGRLYKYQILANDIDSSNLIYSLISGPIGLKVNTNGEVSWTPGFDQSGQHVVKLSVSDGSLTAEQSYSIDVLNVNRPPVITSTAVTTVNEMELYRYAVVANDPDNETLSYRVTGPDSMVINATGVIEWMPDNTQAGEYQILVEVEDTNGAVAKQTYSLVVADAIENELPEIVSQAPEIAIVEEKYQYQVNAIDADDQELTFSLLQGPEFLVVSEKGAVSGTPEAANLGNHQVVIEIHDGIESILHEFNIAVIELPDTPPAHWGKEYWLSDAMDSLYDSEHSFKVFLSALTETEVFIEFTDENRQDLSVNLQAGELKALELFDKARKPEHDNIDKNSIYIHADEPISAYALFYNPKNSDAQSLIPVSGLDEVYRLSGVLANHSTASSSGEYRIIAVEDETVVNITPATRVRRSDGVIYDVDTPFSVTLDRGEVYHYHALQYVASSFDQTGAKIEANKKIAVFQNFSCTTLPLSKNACDRLSEQLPPINQWGQEYPLVPFYSRSKDIVRVVADVDNTTISFGNVYKKTLQAGEFWQFDMDSPTYLKANKPVLVSQYSTSNSYDISERAEKYGFYLNYNGGTPYWRMLTSGELNMATRHDINIDTSSDLNSIMIVIPEGHADGVLIDGNPVSSNALTLSDIAGDGFAEYGYDVANPSLSPGKHIITSEVPVAVIKNMADMYRQADPFSLVVSPVELANKEYIFNTPVSKYLRHFINVVVNEDSVDSVFLDGERVDSGYFKPLEGSSYSYARLLVEPGKHRISASSPVGLQVYGFKNYGSYGYAGGFSFRNDTPLGDFFVSLDTLNPEVGKPWCIKIQAVDKTRQPANHVAVKSVLQGVHDEQVNVFTDKRGLARYCFSGFNTGEDKLTLSSGNIHKSFNISWLKNSNNTSAPVILSHPETYIVAGDEYSYKVIAVDPDGHSLNYNLVDPPSGAVIDASGYLTWATVPGKHHLSIEVQDEIGHSVRQEFVLTANQLPVITSTPVSPALSGNNGYVSQYAAYDPDGGSVRYERLSEQNSDYRKTVGLDQNTGWVRSAAAVAFTEYLEVRIWDEDGGYIDHSMLIDIRINKRPKLSTAEQNYEVFLGGELTVNVDGEDPDGDNVEFSISQLTKNYYRVAPDSVGITIDKQSGQINWPIKGDLETGEWLVFVNGKDDWDQYGSTHFYVNVKKPIRNEDVNHSLVYQSGIESKHSLVSNNYSVDIVRLPDGASLDSNGELVWTPEVVTTDEVYPVEIVATNPDGQYKHIEKTIIVRADQSSPIIISRPISEVWVNTPYRYLLSVDDPQGSETVSYRLAQSPLGMSITVNGFIQWLPELPGQYDIEVVVEDEDGNTGTQQFVIDVSDEVFWNRRDCPVPQGSVN